MKLSRRFEALEDRQVADLPAGRFEVNETTRTSDDGSDAGGGLMSVMRGGRVFEKVGVNISTVLANSVMRHKRRWPRAVSPVWKAIRAFGPRHFAGRAYAEPACPSGAYEHPHVLDAPRVVVWWRVGFEPLH